MKYKGLFSGVAALIILAGFLYEPRALIEGAGRGLLLCSEVIIPSLFPFAAITIFLFSCGFTKYIEKALEKPAAIITGLSGQCLLIVLISFIGGFPVGAKLIDKARANGSISEKTAERMLFYSVNPGPAFVILGIGQTLMNNATVGVVLFVSGILASLTVCLCLSFFEKKEQKTESIVNEEESRLTDSFVNSVFDASYSIIAICGFVILFSAIISCVSYFLEGEIAKRILSLLEISNGVALYPKNVGYLAFLISFSGFCIHFQILSVCKCIKINYKKFFAARVVCGILSLLYSHILLGVFKINHPVISFNHDLFDNLTVVSFPLSAALIFMSVTLLVSVKQNFVEKR